jgi:hypothetical protein
MKLMKSTVLLATLAAFLLAQCSKPQTQEIVEMYFKVPVSVEPSADTIRVGDTLFINIFSSKTFYDHYSKNYYTVPPTFKFNTDFLISRLADPTKDILDQPGGVPAFTFVNKIGRIGTLTGRFGDLHYEITNDSFKCRIGLVAKQQGVFAFSLFYSHAPNGSTYLPEIDLGTTPSGGKLLAELRGVLYYINNGNMHYPIYRTHCKPQYPLPATPWKDSMTHYLSDSLQNYTFVVK